MTTKKLSAWLGLAVAGMLFIGCGASLQGAEVASPKSCLVASQVPGAACPVPVSEKVAARGDQAKPATKSAMADFTRTPYAWMASQRPSR
jgi:hypothetical protein